MTLASSLAGSSGQSGRRGVIDIAEQAGVAQITIRHPEKFNAMSRAMWHQLRSFFERIQKSTHLRCVVIRGERANFCVGGDISEYVDFRFEESSLRDFHENDVWPALQSMIDCDVPIVAQIEGNCMGAGMEIASCCDIRLACQSARFGAPIARLGFPMAPREAALVAREVGFTMTRQMLLEATVFNANDLKSCGFLSRVVVDDQLSDEVQATAHRIVALAPQAAKLNKQTLRALTSPLADENTQNNVVNMAMTPAMNAYAYAYADSREHREGILAFLEKRKPVF